jgi:prepilin-type N-terminal cleavage/methylation domain-containing protein
MTMQRPAGRFGDRRHRGFTLFETALVIAMLAVASAVIAGIQPQVFKTQTTSRDELVGVALIHGCAERLLAMRRNAGYWTVTSTSCDGMGGVSGYAANPTVTLTDDAANAITTCASTTCTATITIAKTSGPAATLTPLTLQLSNY